MNKRVSNPNPTRQDDLWTSTVQKNVWYPYTQMMTAPPAIPVERAEGVYLHTKDGRRILDGISSWWVNVHGHNHPRLNAALTRQVEKMAQIIFAGFTHEPGARLASELVECTPGNLPHVFYSDDGSTAVEVALKMTFQYWRLRGEPQRELFVSFRNAFHGDTFGAMAVGDVAEFHAEFQPLFCQVLRAGGPEIPESDGQSLASILSTHGKRVAAVIMEPMVQGAGGMLIWPPEFLHTVRELTHQHNVPLIADEVFTGFGRTGKMFACEHGPIEPDILCLSKALTGGYMPMAATLASDEIYSAFLSEDRAKTFFHGHSFTGNALGCALGLESLAIFRDEQTLERIKKMERIFAARLQRLAKFDAVRATRGIGALAVIELHPAGMDGYLDVQGPELTKKFLERGIYLRPLGNVLYFLPPYVITDEEIHFVFDAIETIIWSASK